MDIKGLVVKPEVPVESCTQNEIEVVCREIFCVSRSDPELPFLMEDASRPDSPLTPRIVSLSSVARHAFE